MPIRLLLAVLLAVAAAPALAQDTIGLKLQEASVQLVKGNAGIAVSIYGELLKDASLTADRKAGIHSDRGVAQARLGQTKLALEDFNRAVQLYPENPTTYNNRGSLLLSVGLPREAIKDFDRAVLLSPGYAAALANRASTQLRLGLPNEALADYTKAVELSPTSAPVLTGRGRALMLVERPHAAIRDFTRAINADSRFAASYRNRAEAKLAIERTDEAIEDLSRAVAFDGANTEVYVLRGYAYLFARNFSSAIKDFSRAIEMDPQAAAAYEARGLTSAMGDSIADGLADVNRALELDPRSAVGFAYRGWIYLKSGQIDIGSKDLQTALRLDPNRAEVNWVKGEFGFQAGRPDEAAADYRRAIELRPTFKLASDALERMGARMGDSGEIEIPGLGMDRWRVYKRGTHYFAVHEDFKKLSVPLEMAGQGEPQLLDWELRRPPLKGIGALRFFAGAFPGRNGQPEAYEQVAIIDLTAGSVIGIEPHRQGEKVATWTWDEGKVVIASVDGVTDEFILRQTKPKEVASASQRKGYESPNWAPWQPWETAGRPSGGGGGSRPRQGQQKTLFQLLFGN